MIDPTLFGLSSFAFPVVSGGGTCDYPATSNVRLGTTYDMGGMVGTLAVPPPGDVLAGVPTDNTVGTYVPPEAPPGPTTPPGPSLPPAGGVDAIDAETEAAVIALWQATPTLAALTNQPPRSGRLHSTVIDSQTLPYAQVDSTAMPGRSTRFVKGLRKEARHVTLTLRGTHAQAAAGLVLMQGIFNAQLGAPGRPTLVFPGPDSHGLPFFIKWWPINEGTIKQDDTTRQGLEIWGAIIEGEVWTTRSDGVTQ